MVVPAIAVIARAAKTSQSKGTSSRCQRRANASGSRSAWATLPRLSSIRSRNMVHFLPLHLEAPRRPNRDEGARLTTILGNFFFFGESWAGIAVLLGGRSCGPHAPRARFRECGEHFMQGRSNDGSFF